MAEFNYDDYGASPRFTAGQAQRAFNIAGALCSVALIVGVGMWGYRLAVRDVSGVPVIRAAEGPMRVAPENPGGEVADHQGMAVNTIAETGFAEQMPDEIVLAPGPIDLSMDDTAGLSAPLAVLAPEAAPEAAIAGLDPAPLPAMPAPERLPEVAEADVAPIETAAVIAPDQLILPSAGSSTDDAVALALAEALATDIEPLGDVAPAEVALTEAEVAPQEPAVSAGGGAVSRSLRPVARPQRGNLTSVETVAAATSGLPEIDPGTLRVGTRLVQLGAFDSAEQARGEWVRLAASFGDLMTGKSVVIQAAESGGRTFYRLRAHGFDGEDDARRFCTALLAEDAACIPVAHR